MREIKFRGRHLRLPGLYGDWIYGSLYSDGANDNESIIIERVGTGKYYPVDPDTVGQFTGLLDSNGKEIYEGDIIEENRGCCVKDGVRTDFIFHSVVFWYKSGFMHKGPGIFSDSFDNVKVIGNVHDDPELLEAAHD